MEPLVIRLRKFAKELQENAESFESDDYSLLMFGYEAEALANEIERDYVPKQSYFGMNYCPYCGKRLLGVDE